MRKIDTIKDFYKSKYLKFGNLFFEELLHNLNLRQNDLLNDYNKEIIEREFEKFRKLLSTPECLLYEKNPDIKISFFKLNHLTGYNVRKFLHVNELISEYIKNYFKETKKNNIKDLRLNEFRKKILVVEKKISGLIKQLEESKRSNRYYIYGEQILANIHKLKKGDKKLQMKVDKTGETISIKLNETLTPSDNAQKYFRKYKSQKDSVKILKGKINSVKKEKSELEKEMEKLKEIQEFKVLSKFEKHQRNKEKVDKETSMFRKFSLDENYEVWVGKNSKSNDLLTTKYSSPNDLWFHIRGASGSHTVLKIANKKIIIDKKTIQTTASIAAYYSKARNASNVPVAYCERKHVKKKKGFKQGSVLMSREKVVFVKPGLPYGIN
jgi:predicted ribosome quality control (RQC) complex YloA/Tae2 family protein